MPCSKHDHAGMCSCVIAQACRACLSMVARRPACGMLRHARSHASQGACRFPSFRRKRCLLWSVTGTALGSAQSGEPIHTGQAFSAPRHQQGCLQATHLSQAAGARSCGEKPTAALTLTPGMYWFDPITTQRVECESTGDKLALLRRSTCQPRRHESAPERLMPGCRP